MSIRSTLRFALQPVFSSGLASMTPRLQLARAPRLMLENLERRLALTTFYVAPIGSDAGSGATDDPWQTLQHAADRVAAGDTVVVRPGSYAGFYLETDGTAAAPITFRAEHTALGTNTDALINRPNDRTNDGINLEGADYVTIEGFRVVDMPRAGIRAVLNEHVTIRDNLAESNGRWGIFTGFSDDLLIEGNTCVGSELEHGIYVSNSGDRPVIRYNTLRDNYANGIHLNGDASEGGDGVISDAVIEGNTISGNGRGGGSGINGDGLQDSRIQNNLLYDNHASGISLYRIDGGAPSTGNLVANNTVVQADDARWGLNIRDGSTGNTVVNNIFMSHDDYRGAMSVMEDSLTGFVSDYNAVIDRFTTDDGDTRLTLAAWRGATGQDAHSFVAAPEALFVNAAADDYSLRQGAPAIDAGTPNLAPLIDLKGTHRPESAGFDIGAFEYVFGDYFYGDANSDGRVDLTDFGVLKSHFGRPGDWAEGDFDFNGHIDLSDFGILKASFGWSMGLALIAGSDVEDRIGIDFNTLADIETTNDLEAEALLGIAMARHTDGARNSSKS